MLMRLLIACVLAFYAGLTTARAQVRIGVASALSGSFAPVGEQLRAGVEQAVADLNRKGGVLGKQVWLLSGSGVVDVGGAFGGYLV